MAGTIFDDCDQAVEAIHERRPARKGNSGLRQPKQSRVDPDFRARVQAAYDRIQAENAARLTTVRTADAVESRRTHLMLT